MQKEGRLAIGDTGLFSISITFDGSRKALGNLETASSTTRT